MLAIESYRRAAGHLPKSVAELVPRDLPAVPEDLMDPGQPINYLRSDAGYILYSVGSDGDDDNGVAPAASRAPNSRAPESQFGLRFTQTCASMSGEPLIEPSGMPALAEPRGPDGDWILIDTRPAPHPGSGDGARALRLGMTPPQSNFDPRAFHARFNCGIIVACAKNGVIGHEGDLPWHLPADLKHFMTSTRGCPVVMGRKTYETLQGPLPRRLNIVLSHSMDAQQPEGVQVARNLNEALQIAGDADMDPPVWIAGGGAIYEQSMDRADLLVRTRVHAVVEGDTRFPEIDPTRWRLERTREHPADDRHGFAFTIEWWIRVV